NFTRRVDAQFAVTGLERSIVPRSHDFKCLSFVACPGGTKDAPPLVGLCIIDAVRGEPIRIAWLTMNRGHVICLLPSQAARNGGRLFYCFWLLCAHVVDVSSSK